MSQCNKLSRRPHRARQLLAGWLAVWLTASAVVPGAADPAAVTGTTGETAVDSSVDPGNDSREVYSSAAPQWLRAVGQLRVPGSQYRNGATEHLQEDCSATLVTRLPRRAADTIITAWHCLANYRDLSRPIIFTLLPGQPDALQREAFQLADGGGMHADWAILHLREPVAATRVAGLLVNPGSADPALPITMAGYSRDPGKGNGGTRLSFDPACQVTARGAAASDSNCLAHKGASGGAVVQLSPAGTPRYSGVISEGNGAGISTFVSVDAFRSAINLHLD